MVHGVLHRVMDAREKFGEHENSVKVARGDIRYFWLLSQLPKCIHLTNRFHFAVVCLVIDNREFYRFDYQYKYDYEIAMHPRFGPTVVLEMCCAKESTTTSWLFQIFNAKIS